MNTLELFNYLNKLGLADQVHLRSGGEIVYYHWNRGMTDLIPSVTLKDNRIEKLYYARTFMPKVFILANHSFTNNFTEEHKFVRDKRGKQKA